MNLYKYNTDSCKYEPVNVKRNTVLKLSVIPLMFLLVGFGSAVKVNTLVEKIPIVIRPDLSIPLTENNLRKEIQSLNMKYEDVIIQQYKLESDYGKSNIYKQNKNFLGMKQAKLRPTTALGTQNGHAYYNSWQDCLRDYAMWQLQNTRNIRNESEYYQLLDRIYAEAGHYVETLKKL